MANNNPNGMAGYLLVLNAGSSSIKFSIYQKTSSSNQLITELTGQIESIGSSPHLQIKKADGEIRFDGQFSAEKVPNHAEAISILFAELKAYLTREQLLAVGHRVVHGGHYYSTPILINADNLALLESLIPLAPLHQPHNLKIIRLLQQRYPTLPQVACFDTAFHCTQPVVAQRLALPYHFHQEGIRRFGFHGLSYEFIVAMLPTLNPDLIKARLIVAHLGNGASLCAIQQGQSVATTMGFSPLDGLVMGTRCGNLDPGVLLYLMTEYGMDAATLEHLLYYQSGLLGVSGISADMRTLLASDDIKAKEAIALFIYRISREIGSLAAALTGVDALIFTGGIGEHAAEIRAKICQQTAWLGLELDEDANKTGKICISTSQSSVSAWVIPTDENQMIADHTWQLYQTVIR